MSTFVEPPPPEDDDAPPPAVRDWSDDAEVSTGPAGIVLPPPERSAPPSVDPRAANSAALSTTLNPRLAPQDVEAERSVLGGVLLTNDSMLDMLELLRRDDFYREEHRVIFEAMEDLSLRKIPIDVITLGDELRRRGVLEAIGGPAYLASLDASVPATANLTRYAKIVHDKARARRMIEELHRSAREGYEQKLEVDAYLDGVETRVLAQADSVRKGEVKPASAVVKTVFGQIEHRFDHKAELTGLDTGYADINRITTGLQAGDLIIVAGRPSMGKTSFVMNVATNVAIAGTGTVIVFSLEMSAESLIHRTFASEARVDSQRLRNGQLLDTDWPKLARAADRLHRSKLFIDDTGNLTVNDMRARCRRLKAQCPDLALVVVDYLQLMEGGGEDSREQEISTISRGLKSLAKELAVPAIALSQLNRMLERRPDKRPQLSDLRESGAIEQDADVIAMLYRDEEYNKNSTDKGIAEVIFAKQRNGPTGVVRLAFHKEYTRFDDLANTDGFGG